MGGGGAGGNVGQGEGGGRGGTPDGHSRRSSRREEAPLGVYSARHGGVFLEVGGQQVCVRAGVGGDDCQGMSKVDL